MLFQTITSRTSERIIYLQCKIYALRGCVDNALNDCVRPQKASGGVGGEFSSYSFFQTLKKVRELKATYTLIKFIRTLDYSSGHLMTSRNAR